MAVTTVPNLVPGTGTGSVHVVLVFSTIYLDDKTKKTKSHLLRLLFSRTFIFLYTQLELGMGVK